MKAGNNGCIKIAPLAVEKNNVMYIMHYSKIN